MKKILFTLLSLCFVAQTVLCSWPKKEWDNASNDYQSRNPVKFKKLNTYLQSTSAMKHDGVVVIKNGQLAFEWYNTPDFDAKTPHIVWSVTKSFVNALVGIAIKEKKISLQESICSYGFKQHCSINIKDLLAFSSGLKWRESYEKSKDIHKSDVIRMLFGKARNNILDFVITHPLEQKPGQQWYYSSGDTNLIMGALHHIYSSKDPDYPFTKLLEPIGMSTATWQRDGQGVFIGSSHLYATPRDLAKFGYLFLKEGLWKNTQIFDPQWIQISLAPLPEVKIYKNRKKNTYPAHHWWMNSRKEDNTIKRKWPDVPLDAYFASGHHGQTILIIPSKDTVIVKTSNDRDKKCDYNQLFKQIIDYLEPCSIKST